MRSPDRLATMRRDVPISTLLACLRMVLGLPPSSATSSRDGSSSNRRPGSIGLDLEGWLAFSILALPMFAEQLPPAMEVALPHARRMLLAMGMRHSGDDGPETEQMLASSRRELRRLFKLGGLSIDPGELRP